MKSIKEKYRQFLNTEEGANLYNSFKQILYGEEDSLIQILDNNVLQNIPPIQKNIVNVCDIGGGDGNRITHILKYLRSKFKITFHLDFIEQSQQLIGGFDTSPIDYFGDSNIIHSLFEDIMLHKKFDLVFLIHSIFAFESGKAINKILSLPNDDGKIIVISNSPQGFLGKLKLLVDEGYDDRRYEIDVLQNDLTQRQIDFTEIKFQTKWAIDKSEYEDKLGIILKWISLGSYNTYSSNKKKLIEEYIFDQTKNIDGKIFFNEDEVILIIPSLQW